MEPNDEHIRRLTGNRNPEENYKVPDGYFDSFSSRVKERITMPGKPQKSFALAWLLKPVITIPVAVILLVAGYIVFFNTTPKNDGQMVSISPAKTDSVPAPSNDAIEEYLTEDITLLGTEDELDEDLMTLAFDNEEHATAEKVKNADEQVTLDDVSEEEIEQYLFENTDELFDNL